MRGFSKLKLAVAGLLIGVGAFFALNAIYSPTEAAGCSGNSVITCGVSSMSELRNKYNSDSTKGTKTIFSHMGVTSDMVNKAAYKTGTISKDGTIKVDGKTVATGASTAGRFYVAGSTAVTKDGLKFYTGSTQTRFVTYTTTPVYVFMDSDGRYLGAVMLDCGNPVKATNVVPKPVYKCDSLTATAIDRTTRKFNTTATASGGAVVTKHVYRFGDGNTRTVTTASKTGSVTHQYAQPGTYTAYVDVYFNVGGAEKKSTCQVTVKVDAPPAPAPEPGVSIDKVVNGKEHDTVAVNESFVYTVKVTNTGKVELKDLAVTDPAPAGVTFTATDKGSIEGNALKYTIPSLAVGASDTIKITAVIKEYVSGTLKNTACVDTPTVPGNPDDCDDATVETEEPLVERCDLTTNTIVEIPLSQADDERYTEDLTRCGEVTVCDTTTGQIVTISKEEAKDDRYVDKDSDECKDMVEVCDPATGEIIEVKESQVDNYLPVDSDECKADVLVCDPETGEIIEVKESEADKYEDVDSEKCKDAPVPPTEEPKEPETKGAVTELPKTGLADTLSAVFGLGSLTAASYYYLASRRV
jgi:uncharacterized repeat protein (TIGR01451 family)